MVKMLPQNALLQLLLAIACFISQTNVLMLDVTEY